MVDSQNQSPLNFSFTIKSNTTHTRHTCLSLLYLKSFQKWLLLTLQNGRKHEPQKAHKGFVTWRFGYLLIMNKLKLFFMR